MVSLKRRQGASPCSLLLPRPKPASHQLLLTTASSNGLKHADYRQLQMYTHILKVASKYRYTTGNFKLTQT